MEGGGKGGVNCWFLEIQWSTLKWSLLIGEVMSVRGPKLADLERLYITDFEVGEEEEETPNFLWRMISFVTLIVLTIIKLSNF